MNSLPVDIAAQFSQMSGYELAGVILAIAYLVLAIRENIWCWFCAAISTAIYVVLFAEAKLYMESLLNIFYFGMAVYGWISWRNVAGDTDELPITIWPRNFHLIAIVMIAALSLSTGYVLDRYSDAAFPYVDSMTTYSAVWATFLVARKVLENWWYWLVIDLVSIFIYWSRDLELTSLLFVLYVALIPLGLIAWTRSWRNAQTLPEAG
ncbi:MAG: nicotinamide mononucleotide transporter [Gammaproteobacteria bacterium]|nr:nicotinamide mononucleotide transporter [Gammaproteobacteria bacterium]